MYNMYAVRDDIYFVGLQTCFEWFTHGMSDLDQDAQLQFFQKCLLHLDAGKICSKGFRCFRKYFESVNTSEHKLKKASITGDLVSWFKICLPLFLPCSLHYYYYFIIVVLF